MWLHDPALPLTGHTSSSKMGSKKFANADISSDVGRPTSRRTGSGNANFTDLIGFALISICNPLLLFDKPAYILYATHNES